MTPAKAIIIAGVLVAAAIMLGNHYQLSLMSNGAVMRLDPWSGAVSLCAPRDPSRDENGYVSHARMLEITGSYQACQAASVSSTAFSP